MSKNLEQLFHDLDTSEVSHLLDTVMFKIRREQRRRAFFYRELPSLFGLFFSSLSVIYAFFITIQDVNQSGFVDFIKEFFVDFSGVLSSWQSYSLTLLDTLPMMSLAGICVSLFCFFWMLRLCDCILSSRISINKKIIV